MRTNSKFLASTFLCLLSIFSIQVLPVSAVPLTPTIENAYAESSGSVTIIFYGKIATVGDLPTTYTATSSPDSKTASTTSLGEGGRGVITISGLRPDTSYTFNVRATNSSGTSSSSNDSSLVRTLKSGFVPLFGEIVSTSTGFTTSITNFDSNFTYAISVDKGSSSIAPYDGSITVQNIGNPGDSATATVKVSRTGYDTTETKLTGKSRSTNEAHKIAVVTAPILTYNTDSVKCTLGTYNFLRNGKFSESANISAFTTTLIVEGKRVGIVSSDNFKIQPRFLFPDTSELAMAKADSTSTTWDISKLVTKSPVFCEVAVVQEQTSFVSASNVFPPVQVRASTKAKTITCVKGTIKRTVLGKNPRCPRGFIQQ